MISAYESIQNPKEGTILDVIQATNDSLSNSNIKDSFQKILQESIKKAKISLDATQLKMDLYQKTNTVDAGGYGFLLMLEGFLDGLNGKKYHFNIPQKKPQKTTSFLQIIDHRYEVISLIQSPKITKEKIVDQLINYGNCLDIVQANQKTKIHIHTDLPDEVIGLISQYGTVINTKTTDMTQQVEENKNHKQAIGLVVDSTSSLDSDFTLENDISVVQFKAKWEKVDQKINNPKISIYQKMKLFENQTEKYGWPKTSQPSPQAFLIAFKEQLQKYNYIICITASSAVSGSYNCSLQAKSFLPISDQNRVIIPDFRQVGPGQAFLTIKAVELIKQGYSHHQIEKTLFTVSNNLKVFVIPDKISWIVKGGRVNGNKAKIVNFLQKFNFRPTFYLTPKNIGIMKIYFGHKSVSFLINKYLNQIAKKNNINNLPLKIIIQHSCDNKVIEQLIQKLDPKKFEIIHNSLLSPVLGIHGGPDSIAIGVLIQKI
ncbi:hypothetical protein SDC9_89263 [bioreactor metagenome]|uniref:Fatty acid kinase subunit A-like C-terminal domain-containing protein n=1 Tax=bioreactor metagenome TaxID=1076179 RepID=A0A644ZPC9_9ZZZZ